MGMFTTIVTEDDSIQIKTGYDECEYYKIGEPIPWTPRRWSPGYSPDGVYDGWSEKGINNVWVIFKDCKPIAVEPMDGEENQYNHLLWKYKIQPPDPELWTDAEWAEVAKDYWMSQQKKVRVAAREYKSTKEYFAAAGYIRAQLRQPSFTRMVLGMEPIPPPKTRCERIMEYCTDMLKNNEKCLNS